MVKNIKLTVGLMAFWQGQEFKIVAEQPSNWVLYSETHKSDSALVVHKRQVQPLITSIFKLNDEVRSVFGGFSGIVIGFEKETNRALCMPIAAVRCLRAGEDKIDRVRYAYRFDELEFRPKETAFRTNKVSTVKFAHGTCEMDVRALPYPEEPALLALYRTDNGEFVGCVKKSAPFEDLPIYGIKYVR
jgi:hypothetical protein